MRLSKIQQERGSVGGARIEPGERGTEEGRGMDRALPRPAAGLACSQWTVSLPSHGLGQEAGFGAWSLAQNSEGTQAPVLSLPPSRPWAASVKPGGKWLQRNFSSSNNI